MRIKPYTERGIKRLACIRCGRKPAHASWQICADGKQYRPLCLGCDILLNEMVMEWANIPDRKAKMDAYRHKEAPNGYSVIRHYQEVPTNAPEKG